MNRQLNIVKDMVDYYGLNNRVKERCFTDPNTLAFFSFDTGDIEVCNSRISNRDEFVVTALHEVKHALQAREMGLDEFARQYNLEGDYILEQGGDDYSENPYEIEAERWARIQFKNWI